MLIFNIALSAIPAFVSFYLWKEHKAKYALLITCLGLATIFLGTFSFIDEDLFDVLSTALFTFILWYLWKFYNNKDFFWLFLVNTAPLITDIFQYYIRKGVILLPIISKSAVSISLSYFSALFMFTAYIIIFVIKPLVINWENREVNPIFKNIQSKSTKQVIEFQKTITRLSLEVAKKFNVKLDFSVDSIKEVEKILDSLSKEYRKKKKKKKGAADLAFKFTAYIITVIEKNITKEGRWERDHPDFGEHTFPYYLGDGNVIFPYEWCFKRIHGGKKNSVWAKFKTLVLNKKKISKK